MTPSIKNENGYLLTEEEQIMDRWADYFRKLLKKEKRTEKINEKSIEEQRGRK